MTAAEDIAALSAAGESETVEFKATTGQRLEGAKTLSAMLNGDGGQVLYGVQPSGKVTGQQVSDRVEVWSPGGLHFGLTPAHLYEPHGSQPWNPNILGSLYRCGIVEQLGSGTLRMVRLCADAGLGRPVFKSAGPSVMCTVPRRGYWLTPQGSPITTDNLEAAVLTVLSDGPAVLSRITANASVSAEQARRDADPHAREGHGASRRARQRRPLVPQQRLTAALSTPPPPMNKQ